MARTKVQINLTPIRRKPYKPLFSQKLDVNAYEKIDQIIEETGFTKWIIVNTLICNALGIDTNGLVDLSEYTKTKNKR